METEKAIAEYKQKFTTKSTFLYFVLDYQLSHFEKPLKEKVPRFSELYPSINSNINKILDGCADKYNLATTKEDYSFAIKYGLKTTETLLKEKKFKKVI